MATVSSTKHRVAAAGVRLPPRYEQGWYQMFCEATLPFLKPGAEVLDAGSGRRSAIRPADRPAGLRWTGLDLSAAELERAEAGAYDDIVEADLVDRVPALEGRFDVITSYQVLEHVKPLPAALDNLRAYLRPEGVLIALFSGRWSRSAR